MRLSFKASAVAALGLVLMACSSAPSGDAPTSATSDLRSLSKGEALSDFDQIVASFRGLYGALTRKEQRYGFTFDTLAKDYRARVGQAKSEAEVMGLFQEFISRFNDAHVSLGIELVADASRSFSLPLLVMPIENTYVVYLSGRNNTAVQRGDEILSIDGVSVKDLVAQYSKYVGTPTEATRKHFASLMVTQRPSYLSSGISLDVPAKVMLRDAQGVKREVSIPWNEVAHEVQPTTRPIPAAGASNAKNITAFSTPAARVTKAELTELGARAPFFMTDAAKASLGITAEVAPSEGALTKFGLTPAAAAEINYFAVTYAINGKKVLFVRLPDYDPVDSEASLNYLRALFDEQAPLVDGLIVDETHNPGGASDFAESIVTLLAKKQINRLVQRMHADRLWIGAFADSAAQLAQLGPAADPYAVAFANDAHLIDLAYSAHKPLSPPMPLFDVSNTLEADAAHWSKPVMMLTDELSVSCADFVPLLVKANGIGPLFGQTTMGGGGSVEQVATLTNTQGMLSLSRGIGTVFDPTGTYPESTIIEDNGVSPDITYSHTLSDFRAGYVGYVNAVNSAFAEQLGQQ